MQKKYILFLLITVIFSGCGFFQNSDNYLAEKGVLNLSGLNFNNKYVALDGQWEFYHRQLLYSSDFKNSSNNNQSKSYIKVPASWNFVPTISDTIQPFDFGTYRLKIIVDKNIEKWAIKNFTPSTASRIFVNGELLMETGKVGTSQKNSIPDYEPGIASFNNKSSEIEIIIQVSNFHHKNGGLRRKIELGSNELINRYHYRSLLTYFSLMGSVFIMALYHIGLFWVRKKDRSALYFGLVCLAVELRILFTGEYPINFLIPVSYNWKITFEYLGFYIAVPAFAAYTYRLFEKNFNKFVLYSSFIIGFAFTGIVIFSPPQIFIETLLFYEIFTVISIAYALFVIIKAILNHKTDAYVFLFGFFILFITLINDILYQSEIIFTGDFFSYGLFAFILIQGILISMRYSAAFTQIKYLSETLNQQNDNLDKLVEQRTAKLEETKKEIEQQRETLALQKRELIATTIQLTATNKKLENREIEVLQQNEEINQKNRKLTDSISYASRIQAATLPPDGYTKQLFHDLFILYIPKDIVSGDFYWMKEKNNKTYFAVADCTGHGVPGAFMSMLGISLLNEIITNTQNLHANQILDKLRNMVVTALRQTGQRGEAQDGMDISLCIYDAKKMLLEFSGANSTIYFVKENKIPAIETNRNIKIQNTNTGKFLYEIKGSKVPVGFSFDNAPFDNYFFEIQNSDIIYLTTDGYTDQFGGPDGKKFYIRQFKEIIATFAHLPMAEQKLMFNTKYLEWKQDEQQIDDILVLGVVLTSENETRIETPEKWSNKVIVVVDDEELNFAIIEGLLLHLPINLIWLKNGKEAVDYCTNNSNINLVLMDVQMPIMNGYEAIAIIKRSRPALPIIIQTAFAYSGEKEKGFKAGCDDYLEKPLDLDALINVMAKYI